VADLGGEFDLRLNYRHKERAFHGCGVHWMRESNNGLSLNTPTRRCCIPTSGVMYAATSSIHDMYMSYRLTDATLDSGSGAIMQSTDAGAHWTPCTALAMP